MAARRLIAILIVLMVISTFAAALAPRQQRSETTTTETTTTVAPALPGGELVEALVPPDPDPPAAIEARRGDQLDLRIRVADPAPVTIPDLGLSTFATPGDPARFDLLLRERGRFAIEVGGDRVGRIEVGSAGGDGE